MSYRGYAFLGWVVWQLGSRLARYKLTQNKAKVGAAGVVALALIGGVIAARGSDDD